MIKVVHIAEIMEDDKGGSHSLNNGETTYGRLVLSVDALTKTVYMILLISSHTDSISLSAHI